MQSDQMIKIGFVGAVHPNMPGDDVGLYRNVIKQMDSLKSDLRFDMAVVQDVLHGESDSQKAKLFLDEQKVDFTMLLSPSLPFGRIILPLARVNSLLGIWAFPEPTKTGVLQLNSFCGLNMLGSIIGNYLNEYKIPYKWFYGSPDSVIFRDRFAVTLKALRAIKKLKNSRIGVVGDLANGFENMYADERVLEKKYGTYIQTRHSVEEIVARAKLYKEEDVNRLMAEYESEGGIAAGRVKADSFERALRVNLSLEDFAKEYEYNALAVSCWSRFQEVYNVAVCGPLSRLNESGIVAPCEADVTSAVSMLILNALNGSVSALNDMVSLDESDQSINLWHCGVAAKCWADGSGVRWDTHFNIGKYEEKEWKGEGVVADLNMKPGPVTILSMNNNFDNLFILTGEVMGNKPGYSGGSGWVNNLKMGKSNMIIPDLINTISTRNINHHYPTAFGDLDAEIREFASWKGLKVLEPVPYETYLQR